MLQISWMFRYFIVPPSQGDTQERYMEISLNTRDYFVPQ
jgi:hypothetical protein